MSDETPYAIHCPEHGKICLSEDQYNAQMRRPDSRWMCPKCGDICWWDDDHYEAHMFGPPEHEPAPEPEPEPVQFVSWRICPYCAHRWEESNPSGAEHDCWYSKPD